MTHRLARFSISAKEGPLVKFMPLKLVRLEADEVLGIYGEGKDEMPLRALYLQPVAAASFRSHLSAVVQVSDMLRSAEASLSARSRGRGAQRPGYSGHNFGFCIDLAVRNTMKRLGVKSKRELDSWMASKGWVCHRRDHKRDHEEWHYNYFGRNQSKWVFDKDRKTSSGLERMLTHKYGRWWHRMSNEDAQRGLTRLGMYDGDVDGALGPISKESIRAFQRAWLIKESGSLSVMTRRTLAYVTSDRIVD
jgi:hypothetical protein